MNTPSAPTLMKQAPNRKGNISDRPAINSGGRMATTGVTNVRGNAVHIAEPKGQQGAPKATGNIHLGNKVNAKSAVSRPKNDYGNNDSYRNGSSYLK